MEIFICELIILSVLSSVLSTKDMGTINSKIEPPPEIFLQNPLILPAVTAWGCFRTGLPDRGKQFNIFLFEKNGFMSWVPAGFPDCIWPKWTINFLFPTEWT
ncbi:hypothetical protein DPEC_G00067630, partial [Dallia pectoralis]